METFLKIQGKWYEEVDKLLALSYYIVSKIKVKNYIINIVKKACPS